MMKTRSEQEMLETILNVARNDERIRAVILNGSRANPNIASDPFQDFDVVFLVTEVAPFRQNVAWIDIFGERMIMQLPDEMQERPPLECEPFTYLIQFLDGNRIDLKLYPVDQMGEFKFDSLSVSLIDKDKMLGDLEPPTEKDYLVTPPSEKQFLDSCNEFWWVSTYVAKGIWRRQLTYAHHMLDVIVREQLLLMLSWSVGAQTQYSKNLGAYGKNLKEHLPSTRWESLKNTYCGSDYEDCWAALFEMGNLFRESATEISEALGFAYPMEDDRRVVQYLKHVRGLGSDVVAIY